MGCSTLPGIKDSQLIASDTYIDSPPDKIEASWV